jgi:hypothetical protein
MGTIFTTHQHTSSSGIRRIYSMNERNIVMKNNNNINNEITPPYEEFDSYPNYNDNLPDYYNILNISDM